MRREDRNDLLRALGATGLATLIGISVIGLVAVFISIKMANASITLTQSLY